MGGRPTFVYQHTAFFKNFWDVIRVWRPTQLRASRAIASDAPYDLDADMAAGHWSLFPTDSPEVTRPNRSRTDVSGLIGAELHYEVRSFLRPELPVWEELDNSWRCLWAAHILRLLVATYSGGVRGDWEQARWLSMDSKGTLEREYVEARPVHQGALCARQALLRKSFGVRCANGQALQRAEAHRPAYPAEPSGA